MKSKFLYSTLAKLSTLPHKHALEDRKVDRKHYSSTQREPGVEDNRSQVEGWQGNVPSLDYVRANMKSGPNCPH